MQANTANALVTGGAKRIGKAIVEDLAERGFGVAIHCNQSREDADMLCAAVREKGGRAIVLAADLTDMDATETLISRAGEQLGPLSLLVNNASIFEADTAAEFQWDVWDRHFAMHLKAPSLLARHFVAALASEASGLVVNIIDQRVWRPTPRYYSYSLSKAALWSATQTMAQTFAPRVRVNAIGPGPTLANTRQAPDAFAAQARAVLLGHGPALSEFGATVRYLWDTPSITGQMIALDGGQHLAWETPDVAGIIE